MIIFAGPCVIEDFDTMEIIAKEINRLNKKYNWKIIFKSSFDKANRSSIDSYRGPGMEEGLKILEEIKKKYKFDIITDVHAVNQVRSVSKVADIIQIPAFLSRQTDLLIEAASYGSKINIKKGQFMAPWDVENIIQKIESINENIFITERGTTFGYNNLIVDTSGIHKMKMFGYPVIIDATHSIQKPGGKGNRSDGIREDIPFVARAAVAAGADGVFFETHPDPENALSDGPNMLHLEDLEKNLLELEKLKKMVDDFE